VKASSPAHTKVNARIAELGIAAAGGELGVAAILYTYRCTIACRHCCFACAADRPDVHMDPDQAVAHLRALHELGRVVHAAGGECLIDWDAFAQMIVAAHDAAVAPHFVETNASFAKNDAIVHERLAFLAAHGVAGILFSADPYHQAFVPPEHVIRLRRIAHEMFGRRNVWGPSATDDQVRDFADIARDEARLRRHVRADPPRLVGNAHAELAPFLDLHPVDHLPNDVGWRLRHTGPDCGVEFDAATIWEIHIDPYDNIQTNCGVILGKADEVSPRHVLERGPANANAIARLLATGGPLALAHFARDRHGFAVPDRVHSKCDLCYRARRFLRPFYPDVLGPAEVYGA